MSRRALIIGGTGQIGRAAATALLVAGWHVTLTSRGRRALSADLLGRGAHLVILDRDEPNALASALRSGVDALIDTVAYTPKHADQLITVEQDVGATVVISSAGIYQDQKGRALHNAEQVGYPDMPGSIPESQATVPPGDDTYAARKVALEHRLLDGLKGPTIILRPCAIHGVPSVHPREWWFVKRMIDRRPVIPLAYGGRSRFQTSAAGNIASLIVAALDRPATRILNVGDADAPSVAEIGSIIGQHLGYTGQIVPADTGDAFGHDDIGLTPWSVSRPFVLDLQAATALGWKPAKYRDVVGPVCDWLLDFRDADWRAAFPVMAGYSEDPFDYAKEDSYLHPMLPGNR